MTLDVRKSYITSVQQTLLTVEEVADLFRVKPPTVNRWARDGLLRAVRVPGTKRQMFRRDEVEALMSAAS